MRSQWCNRKNFRSPKFKLSLKVFASFCAFELNPNKIFVWWPSNFECWMNATFFSSNFQFRMKTTPNWLILFFFSPIPVSGLSSSVKLVFQLNGTTNLSRKKKNKAQTRVFHLRNIKAKMKTILKQRLKTEFPFETYVCLLFQWLLKILKTFSETFRKKVSLETFC